MSIQDRLKRLHTQILTHPIYKKVKGYLRRATLPGFDGVPIYEVGVKFIEGLTDGYFSMRAAALSFNFFLAIFPFITTIFLLIPYVPIADFQNTLLKELSNLVPTNTWSEIESVISDIATRQRGGLLSLTTLFTIYAGAQGFQAIGDAFNKTHHKIQVERGFLKQKLISVVLLLGTFLLISLSVTLTIGGNYVVNHLHSIGLLPDGIIYTLATFLKWIIVGVSFYFFVSFLYYYAPRNNKYFKFFSAGSTLTTILSTLSMVGFNIYISHFSRYNILYGSIGTLIIFLLWIYLMFLILLLGYELNVGIYKARELTTAPKTTKPTLDTPQEQKEK